MPFEGKGKASPWNPKPKTLNPQLGVTLLLPVFQAHRRLSPTPMQKPVVLLRGYDGCPLDGRQVHDVQLKCEAGDQQIAEAHSAEREERKVGQAAQINSAMLVIHGCHLP